MNINYLEKIIIIKKKQMRLLSLFLFLIVLLNVVPSNQLVSLEINKSKRHEDQTGQSTPVVITISCDDVVQKANPVDLICIVDISGSMGGEKIELVKDSLKYISNLMDKND